MKNIMKLPKCRSGAEMMAYSLLLRKKRHSCYRQKYPTLKEYNSIERGDRFRLLKGTTVFSIKIQSSFILVEDIEIEILSKTYEQMDDIIFAHKIWKRMPLMYMDKDYDPFAPENETWSKDDTFGEIELRYTDLVPWEVQSIT